MTQRERMDAGLLYDPMDPEIMAEQSACMELLYDYNATRPSEAEKRAEEQRQIEEQRRKMREYLDGVVKAYKARKNGQKKKEPM